MISALSRNRVIGHNDQLPWHLPNDLNYFKAKTREKDILMGRKTFESIGSKPLPNRHNIVLTRNELFKAEGCTVVHSVQEGIDACKGEELMVVGGSFIYKLFLPLARTLYLTIVDAEIEGDTFFPEWSPQEWVKISSEFHPQDASHGYNYTFLTLNRS